MVTGSRTDQQLRGKAGEDAALDFLLANGLVLVERNFLCKAGEIDLVMREGERIVFVEVRRRASAGYGGAAASVTYAKQKKILRAAQFYLLRFKAAPACRIDVLAIEGARIDWIKDAFGA